MCMSPEGSTGAARGPRGPRPGSSAPSSGRASGLLAVVSSAGPSYRTGSTLAPLACYPRTTCTCATARETRSQSMRTSASGTHCHRLVAATVLFALCALLLPAAIALGASPEPAASQDTAGGSPLPAAEPSPPTTITCVFSRTGVVYGDGITVSGMVEPIAAGQEVAIALDGADVATAVTDATGAYAVDIIPRRSGDVTARVGRRRDPE